MRKPSTIRTRQLVSPQPLVPQTPSHCWEKWLKRYWEAESRVPNNSPQEAAVASLLVPALGDSLELSNLFSMWSVASERYLKTECGFFFGCAKRGRAAGQLPIFHLKTIHLNRVDESASEGQGHLFWACVQDRLLEVTRDRERGLCNTSQFRKSVDF